MRLLSAVATVAFLAAPPLHAGEEAMPANPNPNFYDLEIKTLQGQLVKMNTYRGKVTLVVNVASQCGYTPQYAGLQKLHDQYAEKGFSVLGFPSNDFGAQEPGTPEEIATFCKKNYGVTFPMFGKVVTKAGQDQSAVYSMLGESGHLPSWNFGKYLLAKDGKVIEFYPSKVEPESKELKAAIEKALSE